MADPDITTAQIKKAPGILCGRCSGSAMGGVVLTLRGGSTGFNQERFVLCHDCQRSLRHFLVTPPAVDKQAAADKFAEGGQAQ